MIPAQLQREIAVAVSHLREGGVIAFPTDTFYGLGASVSNEEAVRKVFRIKGRDSSSAMPVLIADVENLESVAIQIPPLASRLAKRYWPGPLTLVLDRSRGGAHSDYSDDRAAGQHAVESGPQLAGHPGRLMIGQTPSPSRVNDALPRSRT